VSVLRDGTGSRAGLDPLSGPLLGASVATFRACGVDGRGGRAPVRRLRTLGHCRVRRRDHRGCRFRRRRRRCTDRPCPRCASRCPKVICGGERRQKVTRQLGWPKDSCARRQGFRAESHHRTRKEGQEPLGSWPPQSGEWRIGTTQKCKRRRCPPRYPTHRMSGRMR
jgi:hypothetical protein